MVRYLIHNSHFLRIQSTDAPSGSILYIHGLGESGLCFEKLLNDDRLSSWNHIVPDLTGYGRSTWPNRKVTLEDHADTISGIVGKNLARPLIVLGHSMGGVIGQIVYEKNPGLIDGFFNVEGNIASEDCTFSSGAAGQNLTQFLENGFDEFRKWVYLKGVKNPVFRSYYVSLMLAHPETFHLNSCELVALSSEETLADRLEALEISKRYVGGLEGGAGVRSLELLRQANAGRALLENAGHWPFFDQPEAFIEEFLKFTLEVEFFRF